MDLDWDSDTEINYLDLDDDLDLECFRCGCFTECSNCRLVRNEKIRLLKDINAPIEINSECKERKFCFKNGILELDLKESDGLMMIEILKELGEVVRMNYKYYNIYAKIEKENMEKVVDILIAHEFQCDTNQKWKDKSFVENYRLKYEKFWKK